MGARAALSSLEYGPGMRVADVDLNLLVVLDALVVERNVTRAAKRLGISQPSCSRALGRLREIFDDQLLIRIGHEMQPTAMAEVLAPTVREMLDLADYALNVTADFDPSSDERDFAICCSDYVTLVLMAPVIRRARREAPNVRVHMLPYHDDAFDLLRRNDIDFIIEPAAFRDLSELCSIELFRDRWALAFSADSHLTNVDVDVDRLRSEPYLAYTLGADRVPSLADRALHALGISPAQTITTGDLALVPALLSGTDMISLMAERGARQLADHYDLVVREPPVDLPDIVQTLHWSPRGDSDPAHLWLRDVLLGVAASL